MRTHRTLVTAALALGCATFPNAQARPPNSVAESVDFENRILAWYEKYLKADAGKKKTSTQ